MSSFPAMIKYFYPDAVEGEDFTLERTDSGEINITRWNDDKLGQLPDLKTLHSRYMEYIKRLKEYSPKADDSDPAPWLNDSPETARVVHENTLRIPIVDVDFKRGFVIQQERVGE